MKIIFAGGGTAGSVVPLLSIYTEIKKQKADTEFLFIGTKKGIPEKELLRGTNINYESIPGGKLRRYFDLKNFSDIFKILIGFFKSFKIILDFKPDVIISAGGYISVPVVWAGWVLRKKILIHQQDIKPSLANILCLNLANKITVTFEKSLRNFPAKKTLWTGNPIRDEILNFNKADIKKLDIKLEKNLPTLLIIGGGTGAVGLNTLVMKILIELTNFCQIIHLTGQNRQVGGFNHARYHRYDFIKDEIGEVLNLSDIILSRAGLSAITEFSAIGKPVILIPMPNSHQEFNAKYFAERNAALVFSQNNIQPQYLLNEIKKLLADENMKKMLINNIKQINKHDASISITKEIINLYENEPK